MVRRYLSQAAADLAGGVGSDDDRLNGHQGGRQEILGLGTCEPDAREFWLACLHSLRQRGLTGVKLNVSGTYKRLKATIAQTFPAS